MSPLRPIKCIYFGISFSNLIPALSNEITQRLRTSINWAAGYILLHRPLHLAEKFYGRGAKEVEEKIAKIK